MRTDLVPFKTKRDMDKQVRILLYSTWSNQKGNEG